MLVKILIGVAGVLVLFGSPLGKLDPNMQKTFEGPAAGVGQSYSWSGKEAGRGKLTIEESVPGKNKRAGRIPSESCARTVTSSAPTRRSTRMPDREARE